MSGETHHEDEYDDAMVAMLELIWGEGFLSPGGPGGGARFRGRAQARADACHMMDSA